LRMQLLPHVPLLKDLKFELRHVASQVSSLEMN
jgi:hypothetical protein